MLFPVLVGCSFSFSAGGPDYEKLEGAIADELNTSYSEISRTVAGVDCPRQSDPPKAGDSFICTATVDDKAVRVEAKVGQDDETVDFSTLDVVYDLATVAPKLARAISESQGFAVTVTCGEGLKIVEIGKSFECVAADRRGDTRPVKVTAGPVGEADDWEILEN